MQKGFCLSLLFFALIFVNSCKESTEPEISFYCTNVNKIPQNECETLVALFESTDGLNWPNNDGWMENNTPCSWFGIECASGHVVEIRRSKLIPVDNQVSGNISGELGNLSKLTLNNAIPKELGNLTKLNRLTLTGYNFRAIPAELGNLTNLEGLFLSGNQLNGPLPKELGNLTNLQFFVINDNQFEGSLPLILTNLTQLNSFSFQNTNLCEPLNSSFQNWISQIANVSSTNIICTTTNIE